MSVALVSQLVASVRKGSRNEAYDYAADSAKRFFDFSPEQQGLIVENLFAMRRDQNARPEQTTFRGDHTDGRGHFRTWDRAGRTREINAELPIHEVYGGQMRAAMPKAEWDIIMQSSEFMQTPRGRLAPVPAERELTPLRPILRIEF
jgi:hypothetical protein